MREGGTTHGIVRSESPLPSQGRGRGRGPLLAEEALREGGDEGDLDEEAKDRLNRRYDRYRVAQRLQRLKEAAPVEAAHAQEQRLVPRRFPYCEAPRPKVSQPLPARKNSSAKLTSTPR
jgi:hypothetical protein